MSYMWSGVDRCLTMVLLIYLSIGVGFLLSNFLFVLFLCKIDNDRPSSYNGDCCVGLKWATHVGLEVLTLFAVLGGRAMGLALDTETK